MCIGGVLKATVGCQGGFGVEQMFGDIPAEVAIRNKGAGVVDRAISSDIPFELLSLCFAPDLKDGMATLAALCRNV